MVCVRVAYLGAVRRRCLCLHNFNERLANSFELILVQWMYVMRIYLNIDKRTYTYIYIHTHIQDVPGGMDKTSGECSLC